MPPPLLFDMKFVLPFTYMSARALEIVSIAITFVCLACFCAVFTILFRNYYKHTIKDIEEGKDDIELLDNALDLKKQSHQKAKKVLKVSGNVLSWVLFATIAVGFSVSLVSRFSGNNMMFGDRGYIVIATGSMESVHPSNTYLEENHIENRIASYDVVEIKKTTSPDDVHLYDIIAFKAQDGRTIVHRVVNVLSDGRFITKGDANAGLDSQNLYGESLPYEQIVGVYTGNRVPMVGIFVIFLQSNAGIITVVSIVYCMLMFDHYRDKFDKAVEQRTALIVKTIEYDLEEENKEKVDASFKEELTYKGETYVFEQGTYLPGVRPVERKETDVSTENEESQEPSKTPKL